MTEQESRTGWPTACLFCGRPIGGGAHPRVAELYCCASREAALKRLRDTSPDRCEVATP